MRRNSSQQALDGYSGVQVNELASVSSEVSARSISATSNEHLSLSIQYAIIVLAMAKLIHVPLPIKVDRLTRIAQVRGADVYVHWSVLLIAALMLISATRGPLLTVAGISGWLAIMFIHECGHAFAAQRYRSEVLSIELYPIFGCTRFEAPWSRFVQCVIVWAGVLAQIVVAIPVVTFLSIHGYTSIAPINALLALLGPYSLAVVVLNLLPVGRLDGASAWKLLPALFTSKRSARSAAAQSGWR